jgi:hypothetical protein
VTLQDRINRLQQATADGATIEQFMLHEPVHHVARNTTANPGSSTTFVVVFQSRRQGILKTFAGQNPATCHAYGQDPYEAVTHEVVAWRLAYALGSPWDQLVPAAVLRDIQGAGPGALINFKRGKPDLNVFHEATSQVRAAAFWDALIGQQDRHGINFRYDAAAKRLGLIDNAFAFARRGDFRNDSIFLAWRLSAHQQTLSPREREVLERLLDEDLHGLHDYLPDDRVHALEHRAQRMVTTGSLPSPAAF